jgi:DNA-directed RNA polymerase subunit RPC12/RpoP
MRSAEPSVINQIQLYRPLCSKCGMHTQLARIEPAPEPDHDLRTFECTACGSADVVKIKFK